MYSGSTCVNEAEIRHFLCKSVCSPAMVKLQVDALMHCKSLTETSFGFKYFFSDVCPVTIGWHQRSFGCRNSKPVDSFSVAEATFGHGAVPWRQGSWNAAQNTGQQICHAPLQRLGHLCVHGDHYLSDLLCFTVSELSSSGLLQVRQKTKTK